MTTHRRRKSAPLDRWVNFRITATTGQALDDVAADLEQPVAAVVRTAVLEYLKARDHAPRAT